MSTNKANTTKTNEDVVDAKETTELTVAGNTAVSTQVTVQGATLITPYVRIGQAMSTWRYEGRPPILGAFYIVKDKSTVAYLADAGATNGINGILLDVMMGILEDKPFTGVTNPPRRWYGPNAEAEAAKEGISTIPQPTGEVWPDTGAPKMRANGSKFCFLRMLVEAPADLDMSSYQLFPIGDKLYTPINIEFNKVAFKELEMTITNIARVEQFRHQNDADYKFSWSGKLCRVFSVETTSRQTGAIYPQLRFGLVNREMTPAEKQDFIKFQMSITPTTASVASTDTGSELDV